MYINIYVCAWKMKAREGEGAGDSHDSPNLRAALTRVAREMLR